MDAAKDALKAFDDLDECKQRVRKQLIALCKIHPANAVAKRLGVSPQYLSDVLANRRDVTSKLVLRVPNIRGILNA